MAQVPKTISLSAEIVADIEHRAKTEGFILSQWIEEMYRDKCLSKNILQKRKNELLEQEANVKEALKNIDVQIECSEKQGSVVSDEEVKFIKSSIKVLAEKPEMMDGRVRLYNNKFGKQINKAAFRQLLKSFN